MKKNIDITGMFRWLGKAFTKFHTTLFIMAVVAGLGLAVLNMYQITVRASSGIDGRSDSSSINFDTVTMEDLKQLHSSDNVPEIDLPEGRTNPFGE